MYRAKALRIVMALVGLLFVAGIYPISTYLWHPGNEPPGDTMMLSLYVALGVFLLLAVPNPSAHRSLIAYAAWANFAHGAVMAIMAFRIPGGERAGFLIAAAVMAVIGVALIALAPRQRRQPVEQVSQQVA